jgi:hypothetical protein
MVSWSAGWRFDLPQLAMRWTEQKRQAIEPADVYQVVVEELQKEASKETWMAMLRRQPSAIEVRIVELERALDRERQRSSALEKRAQYLEAAARRAFELAAFGRQRDDA